MIVNGLLCYTIHHLGSAARDNIELTLKNFYNHQEDVEAKEALWAACGDHLKVQTLCKMANYTQQRRAILKKL